MGFMEWLKHQFVGARPLEPAIHHLRGESPQGRYRLHLRVEPGGGGVLVINASRILHLNPTATELALGLIREETEDQVVQRIRSRYRVDEATARRDFQELKGRIETLTHSHDIDPVSFLGTDPMEPNTPPASAPYRMDLALTYRCDNDCVHCYNDRDQRPPESFQELTTAQWKQVLDQLWEIGIPHTCFTGGEPTLREDLPDLVAYAEDLGLVTGLLTNGRRLSDQALVDKLVSSGLDHFQITLESHLEAVHDEIVGSAGAFKETVNGICCAINTDCYVLTNTTLTHKNIGEMPKTLEFIAALGVQAVACNSLILTGRAPGSGLEVEEAQLGPALDAIHATAHRLGLRLIWYSPTQYCVFNPVEHGLGVKQCSAARINMCVEPDGQVIPCQSCYTPLGSILTQPWESIWNHPLALKLRQREGLPGKCDQCPELPLCGGGCPLAWEEQSRSLCRESLAGSS